MSIIPPAKVLIGNYNPKLDKFNDDVPLLQSGGYKKINAIRVYYTDKYVRGFEIFYKLLDGDLMKAGHNTPKKKKETQCSIFEIGPDDYLSEIQGAFLTEKKKNKIINITFLTYRGKAATFGGQGVKQFGFCFPGFTFGAFSGGFKKQIEWLEINVLPLPEEFKKDFQKFNVNVVLGMGNNGAPYVQDVVAVDHPFGVFAKVQMPQITLQRNSMPQELVKAHSLNNEREKAHSDSFNVQIQQNSYQDRDSNPMFSSKYPTFNNVPTNHQLGQPTMGYNQQQPQQYQYPQQQQQYQQQPQWPYPAQPQYPGQISGPTQNIAPNQYQYPAQYPAQMQKKP